MCIIGLKGQQRIAQGNALGKAMMGSQRPVRAKELRQGDAQLITLLPFQGVDCTVTYTQGAALGYSLIALSGRRTHISNLQKIELNINL